MAGSSGAGAALDQSESPQETSERPGRDRVAGLQAAPAAGGELAGSDGVDRRGKSRGRRPSQVPVAGAGRELDDKTRSDMEERLGDDFSSVRVHTDAAAADSAGEMGARAYTVGEHVVFAGGAYAPETTDGRRTLAHELVHVQQQRQGAVPGKQRSPGLSVSEPDDAFEQEANRLAGRAVAAPPARLRPSALPAAGPRRPATAGVTIQRDPAPTPAPGPAPGNAPPAANPPPGNAPPAPAGAATKTIADLDKAISDGNRDEIVTVCGQLSAPDKQTVLQGYRAKLPHALNYTQIKYAAKNLGAPLVTIFDWMSAASFLTSNIDYVNVQQLIKDAPPEQRKDVANPTNYEASKKFFHSICTSTTIYTATEDLQLDLDAKLDWIENETSLSYQKALDLVKNVPGNAQEKSAQQLKVTVEPQWLKFWMHVCNDDEMADLVDFLFPYNLPKKLEWMGAEGTSLKAINAKLHGPQYEPRQGAWCYDSDKVRDLLIDKCDKDEFADVVVWIGGTWAQQKAWLQAAKVKLYRVAPALRKYHKSDAPFVDFLDACKKEDADAARQFVISQSDADNATLRGHPETRDVVADAFGAAGAKVMEAVNGQISKADVNMPVDETMTVDQGPGKPFQQMKFSVDPRFTITYSRTQVQVDVGVQTTPAPGDGPAAALIGGARATWKTNIENAWNGKFRFRNDKHPRIPLQFTVSLTAGPNPVTVHSGPFVWKTLNATNWFVPAPFNTPTDFALYQTAPVHEFGHLIGNPDEYNMDASHYATIVGGAPPVPATYNAPNPAVTGKQDPTGVADPKDPSGVHTTYTVQDSIMGGERDPKILARHVKNILDWTNKNKQPAEGDFELVPY